MSTTIRCPDFEITNALRAHLEHRFGHALRNFSDHVSQVEVSVRSLHRDAGSGDDVHVHVNVELDGLDGIVVTAVSHDAYIAIAVAARRARRTVKRAIRRQRRIEHRGLRRLAYDPGRMAFENG